MGSYWVLFCIFWVAYCSFTWLFGSSGLRVDFSGYIFGAFWAVRDSGFGEFKGAKKYLSPKTLDKEYFKTANTTTELTANSLIALVSFSPTISSW